MLKVRVAVLTYRRPDDLAAVLPRLAEEAVAVADPALAPDIVVVDNNPEGDAEASVAAFAATAPVPVHYEIEPEPGISAARNRALTVSADVDLLVFIDDDERPSPGWLGRLVETWRAHRSAAVVGPVVSEFDVEPDAWVRAGRFFDRLRRPTGTTVDVAATNNLLLDLRQVRTFGLSFDPAFGLSGGGDTMFTRSLHQRGGTLVWCDEAVVTDVVPAARVTREWVLRRAFRSGSSWSATSLKLARSSGERALVRLRLTVRGTVRVLGGSARLVAGTLGRSLGQRARGRRTIARGAGMLSGAWGHVYAEYRRS